jgi:hypothetical protein
MAEWTFQIMRLHDRVPMLDPCITFTILVITLKLISWHLDHTSASLTL